MKTIRLECIHCAECYEGDADTVPERWILGDHLPLVNAKGPLLELVFRDPESSHQDRWGYCPDCSELVATQFAKDFARYETSRPTYK